MMDSDYSFCVASEPKFLEDRGLAIQVVISMIPSIVKNINEKIVVLNLED